MKIVIKVGTGVLTHESGGLEGSSMVHLVSVIADLRQLGHQVLLVSSGAVGSGVSLMGMTSYPQELALKQACAAMGQSHLMQRYASLFEYFDLRVAQLLLTADDLRKRRDYVRATLQELEKYPQVVPIINENDTVSVAELKFGDNDILSVLVAELVGADKLFLMTSVDGLYSLGAQKGELIAYVEKMEDVLSVADASTGKFSMGGMVSKLEAVKRAVESGIGTYIANGRKPECILELIEGKGVGTYFVPQCQEAKKEASC